MNSRDQNLKVEVVYLRFRMESSCFFSGSGIQIFMAYEINLELITAQYLEDGLPGWTFFSDSKKMVDKSPFRIGQRGTPDPNGRTPWFFSNGGDPNHLRPSWDNPPSIHKIPQFWMIKSLGKCWYP